MEKMKWRMGKNWGHSFWLPFRKIPFWKRFQWSNLRFTRMAKLHKQ